MKEAERRDGKIGKFRPEFALVLRGRNGVTLDHVDALLLHNVDLDRSLTKAAKTVGISYRNAWDRISRLQRGLRQDIVIARAGGAQGGSAELSEAGKKLISEYRRLNNYLFSALGDRDFWQHIGYRLSARNRIRATVVGVDSGPITTEIKMRIRVPGHLTSIISNEAVDELQLKVGDQVDAIVKATEVIIAKSEGLG
jgi:molybdate transport system regulatory protein